MNEGSATFDRSRRFFHNRWVQFALGMVLVPILFVALIALVLVTGITP